MKRLIWLWLAVPGLLHAQTPSPDPGDTQVLAGPFEWVQEADTLRQTVPAEVYSTEAHHLGLRSSSTTPSIYTLRTLGPAIVSKITSKHYAIVGRIQYAGVAPGSYLEMENFFASPQTGGPEIISYTRTLDDSGPMSKLEGSDDGSDFALPFDATNETTKLVRLVMNLHLAGPGSVTISDVKLVQYPDASTPTAQTPAQSTSSPQEQVIMELSQKNAFQGVWPGGGDANILEIGSSQFPLWDIRDPKITATHYAIIGEIRYEGVSNGELQMASTFAPEDPGGQSTWFYTRTQDDHGPLGRLKGTSDWRPFGLPFDSSKVKTRLIRIGFSMSLADQGKVYVRNVKLVQYPSETFPASLAPSGTIPPPQLPSGEPAFQEQTPLAQVPVESKRTIGIDWKSFFLGIATTVVSLLAGGGIIFISRRWQRRRHERELRRIASLDS